MIWNPKWFPGTNLQDLNLDWILKKISALRGGTTGQYLYKKSNKDFDFGWKTGGGGGGGTSDYLDLDNKPSINNVELTGNKTASDLGLAASTDIPVVPVQSVNGKTGAVELTASDVGAYVKPATGIPETDLSSAVQASLGKADTALQAVPPAYRTAAAQDTIDAAQDAEIETLAGSLAMVESSPATTAHVIGEYIVYNGQLYKVTAAIAQGETLTPGTNIAAVNNGGLNDLKNYFAPYEAGYSDFNSSAFQLESWGRIYVYVSGHVCIIGISGLKPISNLSANTAVCKLPFVSKSAVLVVLTNGGKAFIQVNNNTLYVSSGVTAGTELNGQLAILI